MARADRDRGPRGVAGGGRQLGVNPARRERDKEGLRTGSEKRGSPLRPMALATPASRDRASPQWQAGGWRLSDVSVRRAAQLNSTAARRLKLRGHRWLAGRLAGWLAGAVQPGGESPRAIVALRPSGADESGAGSRLRARIEKGVVTNAQLPIRSQRRAHRLTAVSPSLEEGKQPIARRVNLVRPPPWSSQARLLDPDYSMTLCCSSAAVTLRWPPAETPHGTPWTRVIGRLAHHALECLWLHRRRDASRKRHLQQPSSDHSGRPVSRHCAEMVGPFP
eukprot:scaffold2998_cov390-Prasinococcus_capsulatus_cf.AAC.5